jgi:hypothetical protein
MRPRCILMPRRSGEMQVPDLIEFEPSQPDRVVLLVPLEHLPEPHPVRGHNDVIRYPVKLKPNSALAEMLQGFRAQGP